MKEQLKLTVRDQRIVKVEGEKVATDIKALIAKHANADWNAEWMWGLNPKAKAPSRQRERFI